MKYAVHLYDFRRELAENFVGTLRRIAALGYDGMEIAGNRGPLPPYGLAALLREIGLGCAGFMFDAGELLDPGNIAYEYAEKVHSPTVTVNAGTDTCGEWRRIAESYFRIGQAAAAHGLVLSCIDCEAMYSPAEGIPAFFRIMDATDPAQVYWEPDIGRLARCGLDPAAVIRKYGNRILQIRMENIRVPDDKGTAAEFVSGAADLRSVIAEAWNINAKWLICKLDRSNDPFRGAAENLEYIKRKTERLCHLR